MTNAELIKRIRREVDRLYDEANNYDDSRHYLGELDTFLSTLEAQEPEVKPEELKKAAEEYKQGEIDTYVDYHDEDGEPLCFMEALKPAFIAGAKWKDRSLNWIRDLVKAAIKKPEEAQGILERIDRMLNKEDEK